MCMSLLIDIQVNNWKLLFRHCNFNIITWYDALIRMLDVLFRVYMCVTATVQIINSRWPMDKDVFGLSGVQPLYSCVFIPLLTSVLKLTH